VLLPRNSVPLLLGHLMGLLPRTGMKPAGTRERHSKASRSASKNALREKYDRLLDRQSRIGRDCLKATESASTVHRSQPRSRAMLLPGCSWRAAPAAVALGGLGTDSPCPTRAWNRSIAYA
jgi:hypothetical protein